MSALIRQSHANNDTPLWATTSAPVPPPPVNTFQSVFGYQDHLPFPYLTIAEVGVDWTPLVSATITPNQNGNVSVVASARIISEVNPQLTAYVIFRVNGVIQSADSITNALTSTNVNDNYIVNSEWFFPSTAGTPYTVEFLAASDYDSGSPGFTCIVARMLLLSN
jgi:hypothetical protein